jgi:hypothetical protein
MKDIIPLNVDTSRWKQGVYVRGKMVRKLNLTTWLKRHDPCYVKYNKSRIRLEQSDGFRVFIMAACRRCQELYIVDDMQLPLPHGKLSIL